MVAVELKYAMFDSIHAKTNRGDGSDNKKTSTVTEQTFDTICEL